MQNWARLGLAEQTWAIENYHRGRSSAAGWNDATAREPGEAATATSTSMAIRAFLRLERHFYATGVSWYEAKAWQIVRGAIRAYIANPLYGLS